MFRFAFPKSICTASEVGGRALPEALIMTSTHLKVANG